MSCDRRCFDGGGVADGSDCSTCPGRDAGPRPVAPQIPDPPKLAAEPRDLPPPTTNVISVRFRTVYHAEGELAAELKRVFYSFAGRMSVASAIGALRIAEKEILDEQ